MTLFLRRLDNRLMLQDARRAPSAAWWATPSLQAACDAAIGDDKPLFLMPGVYPTGAIRLAAARRGSRFRLEAKPESAVVTLRAPGSHLLRIDPGFEEVHLNGVSFEGAGIPLSDTSPLAALLRFDGGGRVERCRLRNCPQAAISLTGEAQVSVSDSVLQNCGIAIWSLDGRLLAENNRIADCADNGILVWRSKQEPDGSRLRGNEIAGVGNRSGGTGQYGNGIGVFRAGGVVIERNRISGCRFSAVRINGGSQARVAGNTCTGSREVAIFVEAPGANLNTTNVVIDSNVIDGAGVGISVANAGLYGDGATRGTLVNNNEIRNLVIHRIDEAGYQPPLTQGAGIICEIETRLTHNTVENAAGPGILLGTNNAARDLTALGNTVRKAPLGIGFSADRAARGIVISGNVVSGYRKATTGAPEFVASGAIVPVGFDGSTYSRATTNPRDYVDAEVRTDVLTISGNRDAS